MLDVQKELEFNMQKIIHIKHSFTPQIDICFFFFLIYNGKIMTNFS